MFYQLKRDIATFKFNSQIKRVLDLPPIHCDPLSPVTIVSQLRHADIYMYLAAIQSFTHRITPNNIIVIDDGLTPNDHCLLQKQIKTIEIKPIEAISTGSCPRGGTWERLLHILDLSEESYVIQLDADTLTEGRLDEIETCIKQNISFSLGSALETSITSFQTASQSAQLRLRKTKHLQLFAESALSQFENASKMKYVRGNSAFAGFAKGEHSRDETEQFSCKMADILGHKIWEGWGSEQVASNISVANAANAIILPFSKYCFFDPKSFDHYEPIFIHFMGSYRFCQGVYAERTRQQINYIDQWAALTEKTVNHKWLPVIRRGNLEPVTPSVLPLPR